MSNLIGHSIDRYHVVEQIGQGGMATVYKAYDTRLERYVALKVIRAQVAAPEFIQRFEREAKALAQLSHPNIVKVLDYGQYGDQPYLVMEYFAGGTLKQRLGQAFAFQEAARLLAPIASALSYAHTHKIVHRDIKPANILMTESGVPMLSDFGIAKILESGEGHDLTGTGVGIGTPEYMAPEQGLGKKIDYRIDIYALGIILYEMIVGRKPFQADTPMAVVLKQIAEPLPRPKSFVPALPEYVEQVLFKALAKNPDDRFLDMAVFLKQLEEMTRAQVGITDQIPKPTPREEFPSAPRANQGIPVAFPQTGVQPQVGRAVVKKRSSAAGWIIGGAALFALVVVGVIVVLTAGVIFLGGKDKSTVVPQENILVAGPTTTAVLETQQSQVVATQSAPTDQILSSPVYQDDFSDPGSGWETGEYDGGSVGYADGAYFVISSKENTAMWGRAGKSYSNLTIEVDATQVNAPANNNNDYGIMCRVQVNGDGYSFNISGDGFFSIQKISAGDYTNLVEWQLSTEIAQGKATNHVKVICDRDNLELYVNGTRLANVNDNEFATGDIALAATTYELDLTEIHFDNLMVTYY